MIELTFLGTSSMRPTKERNHSSILLVHDKENILFDCGEGTQRQLRVADVDINRISKVCISHWHGDHVLGLPGLVQTLAAQEFKGTLKIFGPKGTKEYFFHMLKAFRFEDKIELEIHEIEKEGIFFSNGEYKLESVFLEHSVPCIGYSFIEHDKRRINISVVKKLGIPDGPILGKLQQGEDVKFKGKNVTADEATTTIPGKKVSIIWDTEQCDGCMVLAKDADLLISEATLSDKLEKKAEEYQHLTGKQAALIASNSGAKKLILTHFSQRFKTTEEIEDEAKAIFPDTVCAYDLMKVKVK